MKTHDAAKAFTQMGKLLRSLPNQDMDEFASGAGYRQSSPPSNVGISLSALAAFSKYGRLDWEKVVRDFELPIELRPRDGARDIMGKILTYLVEHDDERERVAKKSSSSNSPSELSNALKYLLSNG
jgi:hypothetical protein